MSAHAVTDSTIAGLASKATQGGAAVAVYGGLMANEWAAFGGLAVAVIGLLLNWAYKHRSDRRDAERHTEQLAQLRKRGEL